MQIINSKIGNVKIYYNYNNEYDYHEFIIKDLNNDNVIGFINFKIYNQFILKAWLNNIQIKNEYQSLGFGNILLRLFENFCIKYRCYLIEGKYFPTNNKAKNFYIKNGYEIYKDGYETYISKSLVKIEKHKIKLNTNNYEKNNIN